MENNLLDRINALAKKQKKQGLTEQELQERDNLRKEYLKQFRAGMRKYIFTKRGWYFRKVTQKIAP